MIKVCGLHKQYGRTVAVDELSFRVKPGRVTGFLGPNGAGKSTTMRVIMGLDRPDAGEARIGGLVYRELAEPLRRVGALLEANATHGGRRAYHHLQWLAQTNRISHSRVREVLAMVGLDGVRQRRTRGFSLGMAQRLGIAAALLGDPPVLLFDEPVNGLDPEGVRWVRHLLKELATQGRTVFVSSHLISELALTADHLVVIGRGRLLADTTVDEFIDANSTAYVRLRTPQPEPMWELLVRSGLQVEPAGDGALQVHGVSPERVGELAAASGLTVYEIGTHSASLEEAFMRLTGDAVEYGGAR